MIRLEDSKKTEELRAMVLERNNQMAKLVQKCIKDGNNSDLQPLFSDSSNMDPDLRQMARSRICERMEAEFYENSELEKLWNVLLSNSNRGPPKVSTKWWTENVEIPIRSKGYLQDEFHMDFFYYQKAKMELGPRFEHLLTTKLFFVLQAASEMVAKKMNRIRTLLLFRYICEKNYNKLLQMALYKNDVLGTGYLTEDGLKSFLLEYEPFHLQYSLAPQFRNEFFLTVAVKRFFFFLDTQRKGRIRIVDVLASGLIDEIRFPEEERQSGIAEGVVDWFSLKNANRIYHHFETLDQNFKGMLSEADFLKFGLDLHKNSSISDDDTRTPTTCLTPTFVHKLFESVTTIGGRMDFRTFTEFVLANTYLHEAQAISYFVRILDRSGKGYLDEFDLHYFYKDIQKRCGGEAVDFSDIRNDIFDTIKPSVPDHITVKDIVKCGKGPGIIKMLISVTGFESFESMDMSGFDLGVSDRNTAAETTAQNIETNQFPEDGNETEKLNLKKKRKSSKKRNREKTTNDDDNEKEAVKNVSNELM